MQNGMHLCSKKRRNYLINRFMHIPFEEIMKRHQERHEASFGEKSALVVE